VKKTAVILFFLAGLITAFSVLFLLKKTPSQKAPSSGIVFNSVNANSDGDRYVNFSSWTHNVGSEANRILIIGATLKSKDERHSPEIIEITFAGQRLNEFKKISSSEDKSTSMHLFYLKNPKEGANNIIIKTKGPTAISAGSIVLSGVSQELLPEVLSSSWQTPEIENLSVKKGEVLFDYISGEHPNCIAIPSQPQKLLWASYGGKNGGILAGAASYKKINSSTESAMMSWKIRNCDAQNASNSKWLYFVGKLKPVKNRP